MKSLLNELRIGSMNKNIICNSPSLPLVDIVLFGLSLKVFKTRLLGRGFHTLTERMFRSPPQPMWDLTIDPPPSGSSVLVGIQAVCQRGCWVLKSVDTGRCASEDVKSWRRVDTGGVPARMLILKEEWTSNGVPTRMLSLEGGGHWVVCQQERRAPEEGGLWDPTLIGERNECQQGR